MNERRVMEGEAAVLTCADAGALDALTACSDTIANILHFAAACAIDTDELIDRATRCFEGDSEDGPKPDPDPERELFSERAVKYLAIRALGGELNAG